MGLLSDIEKRREKEKLRGKATRKGQKGRAGGAVVTKVTDTGRYRTPEYEARAPLYTARLAEPGEIYQLPDGTHAYGVSTATGDGNVGLYRTILMLDAGNNELLRRTAPASLKGIKRRSGATHTDGEDLLGWLDPTAG